MRKSTLLKLLSLLICAMMALSLFACNEEEIPTDPATDPVTEPTTEPDGTESGSETDTVTDTNDTETGDESDETESGEDPSETEPGTGTTDTSETEGTTAKEDTSATETDSATETVSETESTSETESETETETETSTGPACGGKHEYWQYDKEGHYREACEHCGGGVVAKAAHTCDFVGGVYMCVVCKYEPTCKGVHEWKTNGTQHWMEACTECPAAAVPAADHEYENGKCKVCQYSPECGFVHDWETDETQHWKSECAHCGEASVAAAGHEVEYNGKAYACTVCNFRNVNIYLTPDAIANDKNIAGEMERVTMSEGEGDDKVEFVRIDKAVSNTSGWMGLSFLSGNKDTTGQYLVIKFRVGENGLGQTYLQFYTTTGSGNDWVNGKVDIKVSEDNQWHVVVVDLAARVNEGYFNAADGAYTATYLQIRPFSGKQAEMVDAWETNSEGLYIDAEGNVLEDQTSETGRVPIWKTNEAGLYVDKDGKVLEDQASETGRVQAKVWESVPEADDFMDIAYIAMVDELTDLKKIVTETTYEWSINNTTSADINTADNKCVEHVAGGMEIIPGDGTTTYRSSCGVCGEVLYEKVISSNISAYVTAATMNKKVPATADGKPADSLWNPTSYFNMADSAVVSNGYNSFFSFKIGTTHANTSQFLWNRDGSAGTSGRTWPSENFTMNVGKANYFVIKLRASAGSVGLCLSTVGTSGATHATTGEAAGDPRTTGTIPVSSASGEWMTYVLDLEKVFGNAYNPSADGTYDIDTFYFHISGAQGDSFGIEYFAFIESDVAGLKNIVDDEQFLLVASTNGTVNKLITTETGACKDDAHTNAGCDDLCDFCGASGIAGTGHTIEYTSEVVGGNTVWTGACTSCDFEHKTTVPASVNFFGDLKTMGVFNHPTGGSTLTKYLYDEEAGVLYNRVESQSTTHLNITGGAGGGNFTSSTVDLGKYLIVKFRTFNDAAIEFKPGSEYHRVTDTQQTKGDYRGVSVGKNKSTEWQVAVIDISGKAYYGTDPITNSSLYMMFMANYADIAYVAVVDSIEEMRALVTDETYFDYGTSFSNAPVEKMTIDGSIAPCDEHTIPADVSKRDVADGVEYYYVCAACNAEFDSRIIPASVTSYNVGTYLSGVSIYGGSNVTLVNEEGFVYATEKNNIQLLWHRAQNDCNKKTVSKQNTTIDVGTATILVFRMRTDSATRSLTLTYSTTGKNAPTVTEASGSVTLDAGEYNDINGVKFVVAADKTITKKDGGSALESVTYATASGMKDIVIPVNNAETTGEWVTYVIDLAAVVPEYHVMSGESFVVDSFYITTNTVADKSNTPDVNEAANQGSFDIDFIAYANSIDAVAELSSDEHIYQITATNGAYNRITADGTVIASVADIQSLAKDTEVVVKGQITYIISDWDGSKMSVILTDAAGDHIQLYNTSTEVAMGDTVVVSGKVGEFNDNKQINNSACTIESSVDDYEFGVALVSASTANASKWGTLVYIEGIVTGISGQTVTVTDETGSVACYKLSKTVELGDTVEVYGYIDSYRGSIQIAGGNVSIKIDHSEVGCTYPQTGLTAICTYCGKVDPEHGTTHTDAEPDFFCDACGIVLEHTCKDEEPVDGECDICGEPVAAAGQTIASVDLTAQGFEDRADITNVTVDSSVTATFAQGTNSSNAPKYYANGTAVRTYIGNTLTIDAIDGKVIEKIVFVYGDGTRGLTADSGELAEDTWTGSANTVVFSSTAKVRFQSIEVYYSDAE